MTLDTAYSPEPGAATRTRIGLRRTLRRLQRMADQAVRDAAEHGHHLGTFGIEVDWQAAVANCRSCGELAALDLTESPYLFGRALKRKCK